MLTNVIYNFLGRFWSIISTFLFIPLYLKYLGIENFSVISFGLIVVGIVAILDMGFSTTITREVARADVSDFDKCSVFRTMELFYVFVLAISVILAWGFSAQISLIAISETSIDRNLIEFCLTLIIVEAALQLCFRFYCAVLIGLEKQAAGNLLAVFWGIVRNGGALLVISFRPELEYFFSWQVLATFLLVLTARHRASGAVTNIGSARQPSIDLNVIRRLRGFVSGVWLISVVAVINTQIDRIFIGRLLPLEQLGYYTVAMSVGIGLLATSSPFLAAVLPRLTSWYSIARTSDATQLYLRIATMVAVIVFPAAAVIIVNPGLVLLVWTGNPVVVSQASPVVPWVVGAYSLLAVSNITYAVAIAHAYTRYNNILGLLSLAIAIPGYWILIRRYGVLGAPIVFAVVQGFGCFAYQFLINRRFLKLDFVRSCMQIFIVPMIGSLALTWIFSYTIRPPEQSRLFMFAFLSFNYVMVLSGVVVATSVIFRMKWDLTNFAGHRAISETHGKL